MSNAKQIGLALAIFKLDNDGRFPWEISTQTGGTRELLTNAPASVHFQVLSNEIWNPKVLFCPSDLQNKRVPSTNFTTLSNSNISYFLGISASAGQSNAILLGDRAILGGRPITSNIWVFAPSTPAWWKPGLHENKGNLLFGDLWVKSTTDAELRQALGKASPPESRLLIP